MALPSPHGGPIRTVDTSAGPFELFDGGVVLLTLRRGIAVDAETATELRGALTEIAAGMPVATVVDSRHVGFADRGARRHLADTDSDGVEIATAIVVSSRVTRWMAKQFIAAADVGRPVAAFTSMDDAFAWASDHAVPDASAGPPTDL